MSLSNGNFNAYFIVPFIQYFVSCDFRVLHVERGALARSAVYFSQMFSIFIANSGALMPLGTTAGEMLVSIGCISLVTLFGYAVLRFNIKSRLYKQGDRLFLLVILILLAASDLVPWGMLYRFPVLETLVSSIQFLFRLFSPAYLFLAVIFAIILCVLKEHVKESVLVTGSLLLILGNWWYYIDSTIQTERVLSKETERTASVDGTYLYYDFPCLDKLYDRGEKIEIIPADSGLMLGGGYEKQGSSMSFEVLDSDGSTADIEIPLYYYPTYRAMLDDEELELRQGTDGVIRIKNVSQSGTVRVWFPEPPLWMAADVISLCTALFCAVVIVKSKLIKHTK